MKTMMRKRLGLVTAGLMAFATFITPYAPLNAQSRDSSSIIRDSEIESYFEEWSAPLLKAAQISPGGVNIILVQSNELNAFVAGGANIFFYTGLIEKTDGPGELMGVFAHELGHISGSHLISSRDAFERASYESILGAVIGIGAAVLSGNGGAASTIIAGSQGVAARNYLAHSRLNESSADQAALTFFEDAKYNPSGLGSFLGKLQDQELLPTSRQSEYVRTHPLTRDRIEAVNNRASKSPYIDTQFPDAWQDQHARMRAKLIGFISPGRVAWEYDDRDTSIPAQYARAIAAYRQNKIEDALGRIDALIATEPDNPYFYELKGQMLVDFSRIDEGLAPYRKAIELKPEEALFRIAYAHALIESGSDDANLNEAIEQLQRAAKRERRSGRVHRLLATAHGRLGHENLAKIHLAEEAVLQRRLPYASQLAEAVLASEKPQSATWLKARDLLDYIKTLKPVSN
ncbi:MAG: M48 family metallopeptidase [Alphaproteobacteria bacterium]|nr:M48 family metallopeptidase [Alphaproteobacteria bacterium]